LRPDIGVDQAIESSDPFSNDRDILLLDRRHLNVGNTGRLCGLRTLIWANRSNDQTDCDDGDHNATPDVSFRNIHIQLRQ
jgi:hypothetical protein